jgi:mRNA-degrading endonuclease RelE of RelBE toxin-antitoxin system
VILEWTARFRKAYRKLAPSERERVRKALRLFAADPRHPSLRVKRIKGTADIWEARASDDLRITFELIEDGARLRVVGHHDPTLRSP